ncbi:hypothetical protein F5Y19DRAFT_459002 [Xylariaceae sp. FL1651]|nr:hypothetical protein F5Y19DRAFT_459002 [Xylariaceae sp. FL1651]
MFVSSADTHGLAPRAKLICAKYFFSSLNSGNNMWRKFKRRSFQGSTTYRPSSLMVDSPESATSLIGGRVSVDTPVFENDSSNRRQVSIPGTISKPSDFGLHILTDQDDQDPDAIDIVALHGLNGHWKETWRATNSTGGSMWLQDFLPYQIPRARVMSFGYDSLVFSKSVANVSIFAEQLLEALMAERNRPGNLQSRPIIFVCHSLGGIVVKKAIVKAHENDRFQSLKASIRGIMFFGTPHKGSSLATWGKMLAKIGSVASFGTVINTGLSKALEHQSDVLLEISKSFVHRAKDLQIFSFYETDRMSLLNSRVVEEDSAVLGFPNEVVIPIKGDHRSICRFESIDEPRYRCVWTNLQNIAGSVASNPVLEITKSFSEPLPGNTRSYHSTGSKSNPDDEVTKTKLKPTDAKKLKARQGMTEDEDELKQLRREEDEENWQRILQKEDVKKQEKRNQEAATEAACLEALSAVDYESHRNRIPGATPGTCQWLLHHLKYKDWRHKQASGLLWLSADPGCGKSVLLSYLIDHLRNSANKIRVPEIVCFFFFKEDNHEQSNARHATSAILSQLYKAQPWLTRHAIETYSIQGPAMTYQFNTLWKILMSSVCDKSSRDILIILDGLDECEEVTRQQMLQSLTRFYASDTESLDKAPFIKTIVASRPNNDIKIAFDVLPTIRLRGEDEPEAISHDVELVIQHHIEKAVLRGLPRSVLNDVQDALVKGADRTFLWTTLVIELLEAKRGVSKRELQMILHSRDIYQIYDRLLVDNSDPAEARRLLKVIVAAARPMTLSEMSIAMAVDQTQHSFDDLELDIIHNFEERIKSLCGNFVRIIYKTIYLVHQTARDFLLQTRDTAEKPCMSVGPWQHSISLWEAHSESLNICLRYLTFLNAKRRAAINGVVIEDTTPRGLLDYAGRFWTRHYHGVAEHLTEGQLSACRQLCNPHTPGFGVWFTSATESARYARYQFNDGTTQRDVAFCLELDEVVALIDKLMPPGILEMKDEEKDEEDQKARSGSLLISRKLHDPDGIVQPHTITPGYLERSPIMQAFLDN